MKRPLSGVFAMAPQAPHLVYGAETWRSIAQKVAIHEGVVLTSENWRAHHEMLPEIDFIFSGWKAPIFDAELMAAAPRLRAIFYAAGSDSKHRREGPFTERRIDVVSHL